MKKAAFYTLGCKVNQYETEAMSELFQKEGYEIVDFEEGADVYVINTCTVTNLSDRKSRQIIRRAKKNNQNAIVAVVGCYAQTAPEAVAQLPGVNLILGTGERGKILEYIKGLDHGGIVDVNPEPEPKPVNAVKDIMRAADFEALSIEAYKERTRAFLKVQDGCSQFCSYCIIPYARGPVRSRDGKAVREEVVRLALAGFKEIVLTGIHLASYGKDLGNTGLMDLIQNVHEVDAVERIRLGSLEPNTITEEFVERAAGLRKLCNHYHISLQSGCDTTLKRMNRKYGTAEYEGIVNRLRKGIPDVAVTTDVMVGFPGETEEEFGRTLEFLERMKLTEMHIFKFSPRKGTPAQDFPGQVAPEVKDARSEVLIRLSEKNKKDFIAGLTGKVQQVLVEQEATAMEGFVEGHTTNYVKVLMKGGAALKGRVVNARISSPIGDHALGEIIE